MRANIKTHYFVVLFFVLISPLNIHSARKKKHKKKNTVDQQLHSILLHLPREIFEYIMFFSHQNVPNQERLLYGKLTRCCKKTRQLIKNNNIVLPHLPSNLIPELQTLFAHQTQPYISRIPKDYFVRWVTLSYHRSCAGLALGELFGSTYTNYFIQEMWWNHLRENSYYDTNIGCIQLNGCLVCNPYPFIYLIENSYINTTKQWITNRCTTLKICDDLILNTASYLKPKMLLLLLPYCSLNTSLASRLLEELIDENNLLLVKTLLSAPIVTQLLKKNHKRKSRFNELNNTIYDEIFYAIERKNAKLLSILLKVFQMDINRLTNFFVTAIQHSHYVPPKILKILLTSKHTQPFVKNPIFQSNVLDEAIQEANPDVISLLIKHGFDINSKNVEGRTQIQDIIFSYSHYNLRCTLKILRLLFSLGADITQKKNSPLPELYLKGVKKTRWSNKTHKEVWKLLFSHGLTIHQKYINGSSIVELVDTPFKKKLKKWQRAVIKK